MVANALKILGRDGCEWRRRILEIFQPLLQDRRNVFDADENFPAMRFVVRRRYRERFRQGGERLLDVEVWVAFPARVNFEFPTNARQRRTNQLVIDLLRERPLSEI